jgi:hypothetical protein
MIPRLSLEEALRRNLQDVRVDERATTHTYPTEDGLVTEEGEPEESKEAEGGQPQPTLQVPVRARKVLLLKRPSLLHHQDAVSLF